MSEYRCSLYDLAVNEGGTEFSLKLEVKHLLLLFWSPGNLRDEEKVRIYHNEDTYIQQRLSMGQSTTEESFSECTELRRCICQIVLRGSSNEVRKS